MNPFATVLNHLHLDLRNVQGDYAYLHAVLTACSAAFANTSPDPYSSGALTNPFRDATRRMTAMGLSPIAVRRFAEMLETQALAADRR